LAQQKLTNKKKIIETQTNGTLTPLVHLL